MNSAGTLSYKGNIYNLVINHIKNKIVEVFVIDKDVVISSFKKEGIESYAYASNIAKEVWDVIDKGLKGCTAKNGHPIPFILGTSVRHEFTKGKVEYIIDTYNGSLCGCDIQSEGIRITTVYIENFNKPNISYIKLTNNTIEDFNGTEDIPVRSVEEIALEKNDISWLKEKNYFIVNNDEDAERIFNYLENYNGVISYDTETTGLNINFFGKKNSKFNKEIDRNKYRVDELVGIIFSIKPNTAYYFPVKNRKFKNLYEDKASCIRRQVVERIKARYTIGDLRDREGDMADYVRNTPVDEFETDVILMERVRDILEKKHIVAYNGIFECKVGWLYDIDTNLRDDVAILYQLLYRFKNSSDSNKKMPTLKKLVYEEFGVEQWDLEDFFVVGKGKKKDYKIDFSYMDYNGTRIYAPADGDFTLQLYLKYKKDLLENYRELEYLYSVEVMVSCAIAYMEFYGHRIDEEKIIRVREETKAKMCVLECKILEMINNQSNVLERLKEMREELEVSLEAGDVGVIGNKVEGIRKYVEENKGSLKVINLASPKQVATLFYEDLKIPSSSLSVSDNAIKPLLKMKNENGEPLYPIVHLYREWKDLDTLLTKFFGKLPEFMYPGGYIFSSYGQIDTATGRMNCSKPNAQQYPSEITKIVIPRPGCVMLDADYSQIEYRVLVALSGEKKLAEMFSDPDSDYHTLMASLMYGVPYASVTPKMRKDAKSFNFGIPYGMGFNSLAILLHGKCGPLEVEDAKEKYELYFKDQPKVRKFFEDVKEMARVNGYTKTYFNRYRYYDIHGENNAKVAAALRQAGNAVIQGSAADIFKIAVARNFNYIRRNRLYGKLFITNMVHDELLFEIDVTKLNPLKVLADIGKNMQFEIEGFPPLYIGAGINLSWGKAKGKMSEIHPYLLDEITNKVEKQSLYVDKALDPKEVVEYFDDIIYKFRVKKVTDYITDSNNWGKDLHPAIGNLINLQFTYGIDKGDMSDNEYTKLCLSEFIKNNNIEGVNADMFKFGDIDIYDKTDEEVSYSEESIGEDIVEEYKAFNIIDESDSLYGISLNDLIKEFRVFISKVKGVCGIDCRNISVKQREELVDYLERHIVNEGSMELVLLNSNNILNKTGLYVKDVDEKEIRKIIGMV
ncbi:MAG: DNA polymerase [Candidatus Anstonellales archaeon]